MKFIPGLFNRAPEREFPKFRYHPDPLATGAIVSKAAKCPCCKKESSFAYATSPYCLDDVQDLCPWCIADGSAAKKFDALFSDDHPLIQAGIDRSIVEEVVRRTPGYISWQQDSWLVCCQDACEFHGDLPLGELESLPLETVDAFRSSNRIDDRVWGELLDHYAPGGSPSIYKFVCCHCRRIHLGFDFD